MTPDERIDHRMASGPRWAARYVALTGTFEDTAESKGT
jgi:hypothetical protein